MYIYHLWKTMSKQTTLLWKTASAKLRDLKKLIITFPYGKNPYGFQFFHFVSVWSEKRHIKV